MPLSYLNLDAAARELMIAEIELDIAAGRLYLSAWLGPAGQEAYPALLQQAAESFDETWLAGEILTGGWLAAGVEASAAQTLAEGEFNRFYIRALCRRAIETGAQLVTYRAKLPEIPRAAAEHRVGQVLDPQSLLAALREAAWNSPLLKPGTGLTVQLI